MGRPLILKAVRRALRDAEERLHRYELSFGSKRKGRRRPVAELEVENLAKLTPRQSEINYVLRHVWNPIGFDESLPKDEYVDYAVIIDAQIIPEPRLGAWVTESQKTAEIASYLSWLRSHWMGIGPAEQEHALSASQRDAQVAGLIVSAVRRLEMVAK